MGFVVYDTETTGLSPAFDQIVQFAAIRTDDQLNPIERFEAKARLLPHILPSPEALCVTATSIEELLSTERPSFFEAICAIRKTLLGWSPSTFVGFNSIRFDEAFLRHAFYQTLHPAYLTNNHGNARGDALRLARAVNTLRPDVLCSAKNPEGTNSFRLHDICAANGFRPEVSHEAMADVEATLWLCRHVADRAPQVWSHFLRFTNKNSARDFLRSEDVIVLFDPRRNDPGVKVVTWIGSSERDPNLEFCLSLTADVVRLRGLEPPELEAALSSPSRPLERVRINASPLMLPIYEAEGSEGVPREEACVELAVEVKSDSGFIERLLSAARKGEPIYPPSPYVESQLYDRFASAEDERTMTEFHAANWNERLAITQRFQDPRFARLGRRLVFFERPELLDPQALASMNAAVIKRYAPDALLVPWTTIASATSGIESLLAAGYSSVELLKGYQAYLGRLS